MSATITNKLISQSERVALIQFVPLFSMLDKKQLEELANLMKEVSFQAGETIVQEDALIDCVDIIYSGQAEITRKVESKRKLLKKNKTREIPIGKITSGDTIGLNATGFFSTTNKRTATVTALTQVKLLQLDLKELHEFLHKYHLFSSMDAAADRMLRIQLIKESLPFRKLKQERLEWLAKKVEEVSYPPGKIIFSQGEVGDRCYLIRSGKVEIIGKDEAGKERSLAILKSPTLFGEATLMTHAPRNATAKALDHVDMLILKHNYLSELIETESNVASMFMSLMLDRSKPLQNTHVTDHHFVAADEQEIVILKNPDSGNYFKLSQEGWYIWQQLDGKKTMQDITLSLASAYNIFAPDIVAGLISKLAKAGFVTQVDVGKISYKNQPKWIQWLIQIKSLLEIRFAFGDADVWLTRVYSKAAFLLFTKIGKVLLIIFAIAGFILFFLATNDMIEIFKTIPNSWILLLCLIPFTLFSVALHELGHALTAKSYGYEVHYMGIGWYWLSPVAFTDTSDMWLSKKRLPRIMVNLAGPLTDTLTAGFATLLIFVIPNPYIQAFLWIFALYTYVTAFRMLSPLQELDGYYVLMDILDRPNLRQISVMWLLKKFPKIFKHTEIIRESGPEIFYWMCCIVFLILVSLLTFFLQGFVFKILNIQPANLLFSLALPLIVVVISCLGIIADIKGKAEE